MVKLGWRMHAWCMFAYLMGRVGQARLKGRPRREYQEDVEMLKAIKQFMRDEQGLETVEYAVMTALIVGALVTAIGLLAAAITGRFGAVEGTISGIS